MPIFNKFTFIEIGFVEAAFKTEGAHKHGGGHVHQHGTQGAFLPELEEKFFFNELPHGP